MYRPRNYKEEEEEEAQGAERPPFPIRGIVDERGPDCIHSAIRLMWEEFLELYQVVKPSIKPKGRGRRRNLARIDPFFVLMLYLTS
jgi:hypothetical protein